MAAFSAGRLRVEGLGDLGHAAFCAAGAAALICDFNLILAIWPNMVDFEMVPSAVPAI